MASICGAAGPAPRRRTPRRLPTCQTTLSGILRHFPDSGVVFSPFSCIFPTVSDIPAAIHGPLAVHPRPTRCPLLAVSAPQMNHFLRTIPHLDFVHSSRVAQGVNEAGKQ